MSEELLAATSGTQATATLADLLQAEPASEPTTPGAGSQGDEQQIDGQRRDESAQPREEQAAGEQQAEPEPSLELDESERDYTDSVYERYAQHFTRQWGLKEPLDPADPKTRNMLREIIVRGEDFKQLQSQRETEEAERLRLSEEARQQEEQQQRQQQERPATPETPEQVKQFLQQVDRFAETRVRPEVSKEFFTDFLGSLWGDKGRQMAASATPEQTKAFTKTMTKFGYLFLNDALPQILESYVPGLIDQKYPELGSSLHDTVLEQAFDMVVREDPNAAAVLESPEMNDAIAAVYDQQPWLKTAKFSENKVENEALRLKAAMRFANAGAIPTSAETVERAVETGRRQMRRAETVRQTGRLAPGESRGEFGGGNDTDELIRGMAKNGDRDRQLQDMFAPKS